MTILWIIVVCCVFVASTIVAYFIINKKPEEEEKSLVSDDLINNLIKKAKQEKKGQQYSNVMNARYGFDTSTIIKTQASADVSVCKNICDPLDICQGFQIRDDGTTCDLLSNIGATYSFEVQGWNYYMKDIAKQTKGFGAPLQNQAISGSMIGTLMPSITKDACGRLCKSNTGCTSFTVGPSGCSMHTSSSVTVEQPDTQTYKIKDI